MKILESLADISSIYEETVVALGNFDGVHLGHRELFRKLRRWSLDRKCPSVVCTFHPHPLKILNPESAPQLLNTRQEKRRLIAASHVDFLVEIPFSIDFAQLTPERFVKDILIDLLHAKTLVVGFDYAFGKNRRGNAQFLYDLGREIGMHVDILQPVGIDGTPYSSTQIRHCIEQGHISKVVSLLGRHYNLEGFVTSGFQRGRKIGFPTANLQTEKELLPALGVYAVKVRFDNREYDGVVNIGTRPTFPEGTVSIEVHLLNFSGDLYGKKLRVYFVERLREEKKYPNSEALADAIAEDILKASRILGATRIIQYHEYLSLK